MFSNFLQFKNRLKKHVKLLLKFSLSFTVRLQVQIRFYELGGNLLSGKAYNLKLSGKYKKQREFPQE